MECLINLGQMKRILLVEDDPIIQKIHKSFLQKMGFEVDLVGSGEQALASYSDNYSAILLDVNLPGIDGFEVARIVRTTEQLNELAAIPIILLSAYPHDYLAQECSKVQITAFATKPISYSALKSLITEHLQNTCKEPRYIFKNLRSY